LEYAIANYEYDDYPANDVTKIQILTIFSTRREIHDNIQEMLAIHEQFLMRLQAATPMSALNAQRAGDLELESRGISKRLSANLGSLKGFQPRSLRSRTFRASIEQHLKTLHAEPKEAWDVAREIAVLVCQSRPFVRAIAEYLATVTFFLCV
jgi:hypothetical protein